ncbi:DUF2846 domain-containing protein [Amphritea balenae]|uniref:DUF2846 domain-containing protein n=1 Tax=Amphritea balenae TaxID=452629 RepID=A0A3P1SJ80_9GAMM|nr:DUF2846 domain-containing protein [Amphritea balenae]RRC97116.1 DUF2846 domain-containing protein [Amphritea balenae]GGK68113.1 hypothetical protein GCM10007941_17880 [Amphritea balenae]
MKLLISTLIILVLTGCASTSPYVPSSTLNESNASIVYIYRTDVAYHSMNPEKPFFYVDGKLVGKLGTGQFVRFIVGPGSHALTSRESVVFAPGRESGNLQGEFESGKTYYFRYSKNLTSMYHTGAGFIMSDSSSLRPATKKMFDERS